MPVRIEAGCSGRTRLRILSVYLPGDFAGLFAGLFARLFAGSVLLAGLLAATQAGAAVFTVTNTAASGAGSLAAAITSANLTAAADTIDFDIDGGGVHTIAGTLPPITQPLTIDGYTQAGSGVNTLAAGSTNAAIRIALSGSSLAADASILSVAAPATTLRGLALRDIPAGGSGILVTEAASGVAIRGCFVGTDATGAIGASDGTGVTLRGAATVGGLLPADRNLISANASAGVRIEGDGSRLYGNLIGLDAAAEAPLGNGHGIVFSGPAASGNDVGTVADEAANVISGNDGTGILLAANAGRGNSFGNNRIFDNGGLGIDLGGDGVTPNDATDSDTGPNGLLNSFEITFARVHGDVLHIEGYQTGPPGLYAVDFYASDEADPSGFGEGEMHLPTLQFQMPDPSQTRFFSVDLELSQALPVTPVVTAISTNLEELDSSEFSRAVAIVDGGDRLVVTNTLDAGTGSLRAAVTAANVTPGVDTVEFAIPGSGPATIFLQSGLEISAPLVVDGYSAALSHPNTLASGSNATPLVVLNGSDAGIGTTAITIAAPGTIVRGLVIEQFDGDAIEVASGGDAARIEGNFLGTDATGLLDRGSDGAGIAIEAGANGVLVGGDGPQHRNLISGNGGNGIANSGDATAVRGNIIGGDAAGADLGNDLAGVDSDGDGVTVGARAPGEAGNSIQASGGAGVRVRGGSGTTIGGNRIFGNGGLGIDLGVATGVTLNDVDDADGGPNDLQNFPELDEINAGAGGLEVIGSLDVPASAGVASYRIEVFSSDGCDASGFGEGTRFLGGATVEVSDAEPGFSFTVPLVIGDHVSITTTATDEALGNTSEFSACMVGQPLCGDATGNGLLAASDAHLALRAAVGAVQCALCLCDVNETGLVSATDAQLILRKAVGHPVSLSCPACA